MSQKEHAITIRVTLIDGREMSVASVAKNVEAWLETVKRVGFFTYITTIAEEWFIPYHAILVAKEKK